MSLWPSVPGASKEQFPKWASGGGSWTRNPVMILLHTTEGSSWPSSTYATGGGIPHATIHPTKRQTHQHYPTSVAARALLNKSGGVQTNRAGVLQFEIIGYAKTSPAAWSDDDYLYIAQVVVAYAKDQGIPLSSGVTWVSYPASYGLTAKQRLSYAQWNAYTGICGHQHAPENDHGDPGDIWSRLKPAIEKVVGGTLPSPAPVGPPKAEKYAMGWAMLRRGDVGSDTLELQKWLNANRSAGLDVDGAFGPKTQAAVISFQKAVGISADGVVGPDTQTKMKAYNPSSSTPPSTSTAPAFPLPKGWCYGPKTGGDTVVSGLTARKDGITGAGLKVWQQRMKDRGWNIIVDGKYGDNTRTVTIAFQKEKGLKPDGLIGVDTWNSAWTAKVT